ncbi:MAG: hypothetical protein LBE59_11300, partial [Nevskiaceae bacterium]|nr:hypothetical protein [Nevskiaceae bacterium]
MNFDLARSLRRIKPQRSINPLRRRGPAELPFVRPPVSAGAGLLLDTCVYIDVLQGRTPPSVDELLQIRAINHSTVCLSELTYLFGRLVPTHPHTREVLRQIQQTVEDIPHHRLSRPSANAVGEAGMLAGIVERATQGDPAHRAHLLNDACLYLQAAENGWVVLTRN